MNKSLLQFRLILGMCLGLVFVLLLAPQKAVGNEGEITLGLVTYATGIDQPTGFANAGDERLFVLSRPGTIHIVEPGGIVNATPFLDILDRVDASDNEEGLLGMAFHPDYDSNGYFYLNYTNTTSGIRQTRISRFSVTANPDIADPASEEILLTVSQPDFNHNAGAIHFGPDGYLYIPLGDGGGSGDPDDNSQDMGLLLGKVSRIDVDSASGTASDCEDTGTGNYTIPPSNPFVDGAGGVCDEIWASGLRNPWQTSFDRVTGDFYIADVGENNWEEVNFQPAGSTGGENYGWRCYEGNSEFNTAGCGPIGTYTFPVYEYDHVTGCAISGGYVYRGALYPDMYGHYLFTDFCTGTFWDMIPDGGGGWTVTTHTNLQNFGYVAFGEDMNGELYVAQSSANTIYQLIEGEPTDVTLSDVAGVTDKTSLFGWAFTSFIAVVLLVLASQLLKARGED